MRKFLCGLLIMTLVLSCSFPVYASKSSDTLQFDKEYVEEPDETWTWDSAESSKEEDDNCREIMVPSDGRITIKGTMRGEDSSYIYINLYDQYGKRLMENSVHNGKFSFYVNTAKGLHFLKFYCNDENVEVNYSISFKPSTIYWGNDGALLFNQENTEYLHDCTYESAFSSDVTDNNCRKIIVNKSGKLIWKAYGIGSSRPDVRLFLYDEFGKEVFSNKCIEDGLTTISAEVPKGTYYMKLWECWGSNTQFNYTVSFKPNQSITNALTKKVVSYSQLQKKAQSFNINAKASTALNYEKVSSTRGIFVSKTGKVTVAKKMKKGTYIVDVKITAKENATYNKTEKTVKIKVIVK